ncbi:XRE family transcriptional regulator [Actinomadura roseirufa]|uniref:XRE family transcriptional regulator n=1 Tax=Actinomadura roseirufa TaxID=2094049 RepID=UPI001F5F374B|nr:XRE family transcriptional regulator [Actinomadura roseirufa]
MSREQRPEWALRLEAERLDRGWGKYDLARRLRGVLNMPLTSPGVRGTGAQIYRWERGIHFPAMWADILATVFETTKEDLFGDELDRRAQSASGPLVEDAPGIPGGSVDQSPTPEQGDDDVKRRAALQVITAAAAGIASPPGAVETVLSGIRNAIGNALGLGAWEATVHEYGQLLTTRPAGELVGGLTTELITVGQLLERPRNDSDQVGLLRVSAGLSGLLAIDLGDVGDQCAARTSWDVARHAADASGDRDLRVWARGRAAQDAFWGENPGSVIANLATEAVEIAEGAPSPGLARAYAARAYVAADQNDARQAHASLNALRRTVDALPESAEETPLAFRESQLRWAESYVYTQLGDRQASATLDKAYAAYGGAGRVAVKNLRLMRASVLIKEREVDAGLAEALATLHEYPKAKAAGINLLTGHVLRALPEQSRDLPAARELRALASGQSRTALT